MSSPYHYKQLMNIKYDHRELIDVPSIFAKNRENWQGIEGIMMFG